MERFRVGLCSACEGKVQHGEGGRRDGMDGMGWDGTAGRASGTVRCGLRLRYKVGQGRAGQGRGGTRWVGGGWWVVWAEFELGCTGQKKVGGRAGRRAGGRSWRAWDGWGESWGGKSRGGGRRRGETAMWRAAHTHTHIHTSTHDSDKLLVDR